jgi:c-di-GMP-binding flagellar brake protein YcgR
MEAQDYDRLRVEDGAEVLDLLRRSMASRAMCSVRAAGRPETYLSPLREIADDGEAVLDLPRAPVIERALVAGSVAAIDLRLPECRVSFEARVARIGQVDGRSLLRLERPTSLIRVEKRETFRVRVPEQLALTLTLDASDATLESLPLYDLSVQGAAVTVRGARDRFWAGKVFEGARMTLPDGSEWAMALRVIHAGVLRRLADGGELRVGLQFVHPPAGLESAVAKLVGRIARGQPA